MEQYVITLKAEIEVPTDEDARNAADMLGTLVFTQPTVMAVQCGSPTRAHLPVPAERIEQGENAVIGVRLDALVVAIRSRKWDEVEFAFDRLRSSVERKLGTRDRLVDALREAGT